VEDVNNYRVPDKAPEPPREEKRENYSNSIPDLTLEVGLPANIEAETTILGAILLDNEAYLEASEKLKADDFSLDSHRRIFLRMKDLMDANHAVDIVTLANELRVNKEIEAIGGVAYLASLTEGMPRRPVIEEYIRIVKDKSLARQIMGLSSLTIAKAADQSETALSVATWHAAELERIIAGGIQRGLVSAAELSQEVMDRFLAQAQLTQSPGFSYGVPAIDDATGGIQEGEQVVIGCFSGVGKTTILAQIVAANCPKGHPTALFLIEPTRHDFLRRLWSIVGNVRYTAAIKPWLATKAERDQLTWAEYQVAEWDLFIYDNSNMTLDEQLAHQRLAMHRHGIELSAIDYLQRMKVKNADKNDDTRLKIGRVSTSNADLVKGTKCRNVILSQLSRSGGMSTLPTMDRLRESGQIENDAATVLLLHLKYDEEQGHFTDEGAGIIPKQRFGVPCNVALWKDPKTALWCSGAKPTPDYQGHLSYQSNDDEEDVA
jgi:replicative DNA helicase